MSRRHVQSEIQRGFHTHTYTSTARALTNGHQLPSTSHTGAVWSDAVRIVQAHESCTHTWRTTNQLQQQNFKSREQPREAHWQDYFASNDPV